MSTAIGHGLADPKRRGKPVSYANKGRRVLCPRGTWVIQGRQKPLGDLPSWGWGNFLGHTPTAVSKGNPVNIPEPEGWTERCCW